MKNLYKYVLISFLALSIGACETEEKVIDFVNENTEAGAILRQISATGLLDLFDTSSGINMVFEYQDHNGSLASNIQSVDVT